MAESRYPSTEAALVTYKTQFQAILERRPSGMRQRLAEALGKHRSFITQISNPAYSTPIPARHLATIFEICHFSAEERQRFLEAYGQAHPRHRQSAREGEGFRELRLRVPQLGSTRLNRQFDRAIQEFVDRLSGLFRVE